MKKLIIFLLVTVMLFSSLAGCRDNHNHTEESQPSETTSQDIQEETTVEETTTEKRGPILSDKHVKIACVGDSLTYGESLNASKSLYPYPTVLQTLLGREDYTVQEFGKQRTMLSEGNNPLTYASTTMYRDSLAFSPDVVIICLGTNDATGNKLGTPSGRNNFKKSLEHMIDAYKEAGAAAIYVCLPPYNEDEARVTSLKNHVIPQLNSICTELSIPTIDFFTPTIENPEYLLPDKLHLTDEGYALMAQLVYERLEADMVGRKFAP